MPSSFEFTEVGRGLQRRCSRIKNQGAVDIESFLRAFQAFRFRHVRRYESFVQRASVGITDGPCSGTGVAAVKNNDNLSSHEIRQCARDFIVAQHGWIW